MESNNGSTPSRSNSVKRRNELSNYADAPNTVNGVAENDGSNRDIEELVRLRTELLRLTRENNRLDAENTRLCSENYRLDRANKELLDRVGELKAKASGYKEKCRNLKAVVMKVQEASEIANGLVPYTDATERIDAITSEDEKERLKELDPNRDAKRSTKRPKSTEGRPKSMEERRTEFLQSVRPETVLLPVQGVLPAQAAQRAHQSSDRGISGLGIPRGPLLESPLKASRMARERPGSPSKLTSPTKLGSSIKPWK